MKKFSTILCMGLMLMAVSSLAAQDKKSKLSVLSFTDEIQLYLDAEGFGYKDTHPDVNVNYVHVPTDQFPEVLDAYLSSVWENSQPLFLQILLLPHFSLFLL